MIYRIFADILVMIHVAFVLYALLGGLLALKWRWTMWLHLPAALWATVVEFANAACPLTTLENTLRAQAHVSVYQTGFMERYILPILYPAALSENIQFILGVIVLIMNVGIYSLVFRQSALNKTGRETNSKDFLRPR